MIFRFQSHWDKILMILITFAIFKGGHSDSFTATVPSARTQCFHQIATEGERVHGSYEVLTSNHQPIRMTVTDMNGEEIFGTDDTEISFEFIAQTTGRYEICFDNKKGKLSTKRIAFTFEATPAMERDALHPSKHFGSLESAVDRIGEGIYAIQDHNHMMKVKAKYVAKTNQNTNSWILWLCVFESSAILINAWLSVVAIKNMFNKSSKRTFQRLQ